MPRDEKKESGGGDFERWEAEFRRGNVTEVDLVAEEMFSLMVDGC
jgi:hypothetical protein